MQEKKKSRLIKIYIIAVIILLIFLSFFKIVAKVEDVSFEGVSQVQNKVYVFLSRLKYSFISFQEAQELKKENEQLQSQLNDLFYENGQLIGFEQENNELRTLLNFYQEKEFDYVIAKVIGRDITRDNTLIINRGENDGIKEGYSVVVDQGIIMGKVVKVRGNFATVLILTDNLSQLAISTLTSNKTTGLAQGEYGLSIKVYLIPQDIEIVEGDLLITSGLEAYIPRGLVAGKVNRIISHENDLFKSVTISPLIDYQEVSVLGVIIPKINLND